MNHAKYLKPSTRRSKRDDDKSPVLLYLIAVILVGANLWALTSVPHPLDSCIPEGWPNATGVEAQSGDCYVEFDDGSIGVYDTAKS